MFFLSTAAFKGIFVLKRSLKKTHTHTDKNGQVLNKPQMRLLLKISGGTLYQIQTDSNSDNYAPLITVCLAAFFFFFFFFFS